MKNIIFAISFVLVYFSISNAQEVSKLDKMINESLLSRLKYSADSYDEVCRNCGEYTTYICLDGFPRNFVFSDEILNLPNNLKNMKDIKFVSLMNISGQKELKKGRGYGFVFLGISLEKNIMIISITGRSVSISKKNQLQIAMIEWGIYTYEYSHDKNDWMLINTEYGGV